MTSGACRRLYNILDDLVFLIVEMLQQESIVRKLHSCDTVGNIYVQSERIHGHIFGFIIRHVGFMSKSRAKSASLNVCVFSVISVMHHASGTQSHETVRPVNRVYAGIITAVLIAKSHSNAWI